MRSLTTYLLAGTVLLATTTIAQEAHSADNDVEILVQKIKADKKLLVANNMDLTEDRKSVV